MTLYKIKSKAALQSNLLGWIASDKTHRDLTCGNEKLLFHQTFLSMRSSFIKTLIDLQPCSFKNDISITLDEVNPDNVYSLMELVYTGRSQVLEIEDKQEIMAIAKTLKIDINLQIETDDKSDINKLDFSESVYEIKPEVIDFDSKINIGMIENRGDGYYCHFENCGKLFNKKKTILKHIYMSHKGGNEIRRKAAKTKRYPKECSVENCGLIFDNKKTYLEHKRIVHNVRTFDTKKKKCDWCEKLIFAKNFNSHVKQVHTHRHEKNYACEKCGKTFRSSSHLKMHTIVHTGEKNFECSGCGNKLRNSYEAKECENRHKGLLKYKCKMCEFKTNRPNKMQKHSETHFKIKPYSCPICGLRYGYKDNLKQHARKIHVSESFSMENLENSYPDMYKPTCDLPNAEDLSIVI